MKILENLGHFPTRKTENAAYFLSPLRSENDASFKISLALNRWYDHGMGKGGNTIDFLVLYLSKSVKEVLDYLSNDLSFSFHQPLVEIEKSKHTQILQTKIISHPAMTSYLISRKIPLAIGKQFLKEVVYQQGTKTLFALGLENHLGGWELRNKFQKTSSSPKSYTWIRRAKKQLLVTEGMFDFLSLATMNPIAVYEADILVLNSVAFLPDIKKLRLNYNQIQLYLDNDTSGDSATSTLIGQFDSAIDYRREYKGYKDLNEKLMICN